MSKHKSLKKTFYYYILPSVGAMLVTALYVVIDGIFIGQGVGDSGLAAVNLVVPIMILLIAVSMMIAMGGATITSIRFGQGNVLGANAAFLMSMKLIIAFSLLMTAIAWIFPETTVKMLGSSDALIPQTVDYLKYFFLLGVFFCGAMVLAAFIRNDGNPRLAFWGMIVGALSNIALDWLFVFPMQMGVKGAALASGIGQVLACMVLLIHFMRKKGELRFRRQKREKGLVFKIIKRGAPEFVTQMSMSVTILCYNLVIITYMSEISLAAFSVVCFVLWITIALLSGVSQGIQPLISQSFGAGEILHEHYYFKKGIIVNIIIAISMSLIFIFFGRTIISIYSNNPQLIEIAFTSMNYYSLSFVFAAVSIIYTTYYLATKRTKLAMIIAVSRTFVFNAAFILLAPVIFGIAGIWFGIVVAEIIVMILALIIKWRYQKKSININQELNAPTQ